MWLFTMTHELLNMNYVKRIECDGSIIFAVTDDEKEFTLCNVADHNEHEMRMANLMADIRTCAPIVSVNNN
jgi:hypothetical protein